MTPAEFAANLHIIALAARHAWPLTVVVPGVTFVYGWAVRRG